MGINSIVNAVDEDAVGSAKYVAFLFDDGPHETNGIRICDIAGSKGVSVSFAQVGKNIVKFPELTKRAAELGHQIVNHSMNHRKPPEIDLEALRKEILDPVAVFIETLGKGPDLYWAPYLMLDDRMYSIIEEGGMELLDVKKFKFANTRDSDHKHIFRKDILERGTAEIIPRGTKAEELRLVLCHEWRDDTVAVLAEMIDAYQEAGYAFVTVGELNDLYRAKHP